METNSNNIVFKISDLGELLPIATKDKKGLSNSIQAINSSFYSISTGNKSNILYKICDYGRGINHILHIYNSPNNTSGIHGYIRMMFSDDYIFANILSSKGNNYIRFFKDEASFYVYIYNSEWSRSNIEVFSNTPNSFYFKDVTNEISISNLTEITIS